MKPMKKYKWILKQCPYCKKTHFYETNDYILHFDGGCPKIKSMVTGWVEIRMKKTIDRAWKSHKWTEGNEINWCLNCGTNPITANLWTQQNGDPYFCSKRLKGIKKEYCSNSCNHVDWDDYFKRTGYFPVRCECNNAWRGISV